MDFYVRATSCCLVSYFLPLKCISLRLQRIRLAVTEMFRVRTVTTSKECENEWSICVWPMAAWLWLVVSTISDVKSAETMVIVRNVSNAIPYTNESFHGVFVIFHTIFILFLAIDRSHHDFWPTPLECIQATHAVNVRSFQAFFVFFSVLCFIENEHVGRLCVCGLKVTQTSTKTNVKIEIY